MKNVFRIIVSVTIVLSLLVSTTNAASYTVIGNNVRIRSTPSTHSNDNIIGKLNNGDSVHVIQKYNEEWLKIEYQNQSAYIASQFVGIENNTTNVSGVIGITKRDVNFRKGPSTEYSSMGKINKNTVLRIISSSSNWYKVKYQGTYGFISADYVKTKKAKGTVLGTYTTFFSTSQKGRTKNIKKAAKLINEQVIKPKETFSLLSAIGPITKNGGYDEAPEYKQTSSGTQTVTGYGGGVCQVATTLYQAVNDAKKADSSISIVERHKHSKPVSYVKSGSDATISWDANQDFRFKNKNHYSIKIITMVIDGSITCIIIKV